MADSTRKDEEVRSMFGGCENTPGLVFATSCCDGNEPDVGCFLMDSPLTTLLAKDGDESITYSELTDFLISIGKYNPGKDFPCYRQFIGYFSGKGGTDINGNIYMIMKNDETSSKKVFISEIIDILLTGNITPNNSSSLFLKRYRFLIVLLFDISPHPDATIEAPPKLPVLKHDNVFVAFSGLTERKVNGGDISIWTKRIMTEFSKCTTENYSLIDGLDLCKLEKEFSGTQYTHTSGHVLLNDANLFDMHTYIDEVLKETEKRGVILVAQSTDKKFDIDTQNIATVFNNLQFEVIYSSDLLSLIKAIALYGYGTSISFFSFYFSGYGGKDNDRIFIQLEGEEKIYLDWILSLFKHRRYNHLPCFLLFELCLKNAPSSRSLQMELPVYYSDNCLFAMSGLHEDKVGRTPEGYGKWTQKLCQNIEGLDRSFIEVLEVTSAELPELDTNYSNGGSFFYLKEPLRIYKNSEEYETAIESWNTQSLPPPPLSSVKLKPRNILLKRPRPDDILKLLFDVASDWYQMGQSIGIPVDKLDNIAAASKPDETKLIWMTNRASSLTWARLCTAVRRDEKKKEIKKQLEEDSFIYSNYPDKN